MRLLTAVPLMLLIYAGCEDRNDSYPIATASAPVKAESPPNTPDQIADNLIPLDGMDGYVKGTWHKDIHRIDFRFLDKQQQPIHQVEQVSFVLKKEQGPVPVPVSLDQSGCWVADVGETDGALPEGVLRCRIDEQPCRTWIEADRLIVSKRDDKG